MTTTIETDISEPDLIINAIRERRAVRALHGRLDLSKYYVDPIGKVYSLYNPREPREVEQKSINGLLYVTLYEGEVGTLKRLMIGDLVASTFLGDVERDDSETTVIYEDGDPTNNTAENLRWASNREQQKQLHEIASGVFNEEKREPPKLVYEELTLTPEEDPHLKQIHELQRKLDATRRLLAMRTKALEAFGSYELPPGVAAEFGTHVVLESNRGRPNHCVLTVQNFREARDALNTDYED